jgi:hypothetical protein
MSDVRAGPEDYKQLAERCAEIASECSAPTVAEAPIPAEAQGRWRGQRSEPIGKARHPLSTIPAPFPTEVECKIALDVT